MSLSARSSGSLEFSKWLMEAKRTVAKIDKEMMQQIVQNGVQYMQSIAPTDTGFMRSNIQGRVTQGGQAVIESMAYYSGFVNFGTRYMDAQPFFSDGMEYVNQIIKDAIAMQIIAELRKKR